MSGSRAKNHIQVTAALIAAGGRLLIAQRPASKRAGLRWEFPGGKVEPGEALADCLAREIREELCLEIRVLAHFKTVSYEEDDFAIELHAYWCSAVGGRLCLKEHAACMWADLAELKKVDLTEADRLLLPLLERLREFPVPPGGIFAGES